VKQWQRYLAELFGTFVLVFGGTTVIIASSGLGGGGVQFLVPFGFGFSLLAALYAFAEVSGGHFNPQVSLGLFLDRRLSFEDLLGYWIFQFAGGILASLLMLIPFTHTLVKTTANKPIGGDGRALFLEIAFTAIFVLVILQSTKSDRFAGTALVSIPLTLLMIHFALIPFDGCSLNTARSFGPALVGDQWTGFWIFVVGPTAGAIIGWLVYTVVIKGDTDLRDDMQRIRDDVRPPSTPAAESPPTPPPAAS
jgi:aquaporin Z